MKKILLDTNAYSHLLLGNKEILNVLGKSEIVYMSVFVLGELYSGFLGGSKVKENNRILENFLSQPAVKILNATSETAEIFGYIKNRLKQKGTPIPINDVWIAAHCMETGSMLVTSDKHFKLIDGILLFE